MEKGCVDPEPLEEDLGFILYAIPWLIVQIGIVRMVAKTPTHQPEAKIEILGPDDVGSEPNSDDVRSDSDVDDQAAQDMADHEHSTEEETALQPLPTGLPPEETLLSDVLPPKTLPSTTTTTSTDVPIGPTSTSKPHIPARSQKVILRPKRFRRRTEVNADPNAVFKDEDHATLKRFLKALRSEKTSLFGKLEIVLPTVLGSLVSVSSKRPSSQTATSEADKAEEATTFIRIDGLIKWKHICSFHNIMIENPTLFYPLELCYYKEKYLPSAREASCAIRHPAQKQTLCGCPIIIQTSELNQRTSTVGGLLKVNSRFYALTTSHKPDEEDDFPDEVDYDSDSDELSLFFYDDTAGSDPNNSGSVTPTASNYDGVEHGKPTEQVPNVESPDRDADQSAARTAEDDALKVSREISVSDPSNVESAAGSHISTENLSEKKGYLINPIDETDLRSGDDWLLVPVGTNLLFPNRLPAGAEKPAKWQNHFIESFCPDLGKLFVDKYDPNKPPSQRTVWAITGMGGLIRSSLCPNPSFILSNGCERISKVWMVEAEAPSQGFQAGDSGSWIVDDKTRRVLGILVARVGGVGYMTSFASVRQDIATALQIRQTSVRLASRMHPLLRGRGGSTGRVLGSFSPVRYARRAPAARSWSQMLSDAAAATLDVVRHPVDLGQHTSRPVLLITLVYMSFLYEIPWTWSSVTTLQNALLPPLGALLLWGYTEIKMQWRPTVYSRHDKLVIRRTRCTWLWVALAAGISASLVIYIVRGPAPTPFTLRSNGQRVSDQSIRGFSDAVERLRRSDPQARYDAFENDLRELYDALRDMDFQAGYSKLKEMVSRKFSKHKWQNRL